MPVSHQLNFLCQLFRDLQSTYPNFQEKVQPIAGDLMSEGLGISDDDKALLQESVDIVIHSAATVRFDEKLRSDFDFSYTCC